MATLDAPIGRVAVTRGARVAGIVCCVPGKRITNDHFVGKFGEKSVEDVVKMIGVTERHWVEPGVSSADLCQAAAERLLPGLDWSPESVDAIIFVSQTPDFVLPSTACALHGRLGLRRGGIAFDVNLGCSGYPYALWLATTLIQGGAADRVLLAVGDTISRVVDPEDRATAMLFGDAGTVTAVERIPQGEDSPESHFVLGTDGKGESHLIIPRGLFKQRSEALDPRLASRNAACLFMDGAEIFNFTLGVVPRLLTQLLSAAALEREAYDAFAFHQANSFMLNHLAKKMKLDTSRVPVNIGRFGNTSCASIPLLLCSDLGSRIQETTLQLALLGFGVGYSWAAASMKVGPLRIAEVIEQ